MSESIPEVHFGSVEDAPVDWRDADLDDAPDDDDELLVSPEDVVESLGFEPLLEEEGWLDDVDAPG